MKTAALFSMWVQILGYRQSVEAAGSVKTEVTRPSSPTLQAMSEGLDKPKKLEKKLTPC